MSFGCVNICRTVCGQACVVDGHSNLVCSKMVSFGTVSNSFNKNGIVKDLCTAEANTEFC